MKQTDYLDTITDNDKRSLAKVVLNQIGDFESVWDCPEDYRDASGGVSGFIYYYDTHKFAKENIDLILEYIKIYDEETGYDTLEHACKSDYFRNDLLNWLSWFALESIINDIIYYKEDLDS